MCGGGGRERSRNSERRWNKGRAFPPPPTPTPVVDSLTADFSVSFISDEPDYNQSGSISPQKATPGGQSHYSGKVVSVKQTAC